MTDIDVALTIDLLSRSLSLGLSSGTLLLAIAIFLVDEIVDNGGRRTQTCGDIPGVESDLLERSDLSLLKLGKFCSAWH
jgi:hypothetical protein